MFSLPMVEQREFAPPTPSTRFVECELVGLDQESAKERSGTCRPVREILSELKLDERVHFACPKGQLHRRQVSCHAAYVGLSGSVVSLKELGQGVGGVAFPLLPFRPRAGSYGLLLTQVPVPDRRCVRTSTKRQLWPYGSCLALQAPAPCRPAAWP